MRRGSSRVADVWFSGNPTVAKWSNVLCFFLQVSHRNFDLQLAMQQFWRKQQIHNLFFLTKSNLSDTYRLRKIVQLNRECFSFFLQATQISKELFAFMTKLLLRLFGKNCDVDLFIDFPPEILRDILSKI